MSSYGPCLSTAIRYAIESFGQFDETCHASQLTTVGVGELESLGRHLHAAYGSFLGRNDTRMELSTTRYSRTILSLMALLNELNPQWCNGMQWFHLGSHSLHCNFAILK